MHVSRLSGTPARHSNNRERRAIQRNVLTHHSGIKSEASLPEVVTDYGIGRSSQRFIVFRREQASNGRLDAQNGKEITGNNTESDKLCTRRASDSESGWIGTVGGHHAVKGSTAVAISDVVWIIL